MIRFICLTDGVDIDMYMARIKYARDHQRRFDFIRFFIDAKINYFWYGRFYREYYRLVPEVLEVFQNMTPVERQVLFSLNSDYRYLLQVQLHRFYFDQARKNCYFDYDELETLLVATRQLLELIAEN